MSLLFICNIPLVSVRFISWEDLYGSDQPPQASLKEFLILLPIIVGVLAVGYLIIKLDETCGTNNKVLHWILQPIEWVLALATIFVVGSLLSQWLTWTLVGVLFLIAALIVWIRGKYCPNHKNNKESAIITKTANNDCSTLIKLDVYRSLDEDGVQLIKDKWVCHLTVDNNSHIYKINNYYDILLNPVFTDIISSTGEERNFRFKFLDYTDGVPTWYYFNIQDSTLEETVIESI